jgi:hypothetical protein
MPEMNVSINQVADGLTAGITNVDQEQVGNVSMVSKILLARGTTLEAYAAGRSWTEPKLAVLQTTIACERTRIEDVLGEIQRMGMKAPLPADEHTMVYGRLSPTVDKPASDIMVKLTNLAGDPATDAPSVKPNRDGTFTMKARAPSSPEEAALPVFLTAYDADGSVVGRDPTPIFLNKGAVSYSEIPVTATRAPTLVDEAAASLASLKAEAAEEPAARLDARAVEGAADTPDVPRKSPTRARVTKETTEGGVAGKPITKPKPGSTKEK